VPVARLLGGTAADPAIQPVDFANAVVAATAPGGHAPQTTTDIGRTADGAWVCRFPTTVAAQMVPFKLTVIPGLWGVTVEQPDPLRLVFKKHGSKGLLGAFGKKPGLEVVVQLAPPGRSIGEVVVTGGLFGNPDQAFARAAENSIPQLIGDIRRELQNVEDRRKHPRLPASFPVSIYPIHSDGGIDPPLRGICKDVSVGGLSFVVPTPLRTKYSYVAFEGIKAVAGVAILMRLVRSQKGDEVLAAGSYRTDL